MWASVRILTAFRLARWMDDVTKYPLITEELKRRGYSNKSIKKISWRQCAAGDESKL
jgi:microsomal dipeptidase-like Zn-dependent dipeptidase